MLSHASRRNCTYVYSALRRKVERFAPIAYHLASLQQALSDECGYINWVTHMREVARNYCLHDYSGDAADFKITCKSPIKRYYSNHLSAKITYHNRNPKLRTHSLFEGRLCLNHTWPFWKSLVTTILLPIFTRLPQSRNRTWSAFKSKYSITRTIASRVIL